MGGAFEGGCGLVSPPTAVITPTVETTEKVHQGLDSLSHTSHYTQEVRMSIFHYTLDSGTELTPAACVCECHQNTPPVTLTADDSPVAVIVYNTCTGGTVISNQQSLLHVHVRAHLECP